tara:strand:+ start:76151 stop:76864 length:714 start_codon:yes stop_codon:yes gene_type:complete
MSECIRSTDLLLLPGMMCDQRLWQAQATALQGNCHVRFGDISQESAIAALACRILRNSPPVFAVAGLSMGGIVALEMWRQAPHRIERMALLDTTCFADTDERRKLRDEQRARVGAGELERVLRDELKPNYLAACHRHDSALLDRVLAMGMELGPAVFERQSIALRDRSRSDALLPSITCPTLVLCGAEDTLCSPQLHREMAAKLPNARLSVIDDCGHLATMEQPDSVNAALLRWLAQ